MEAMAAGNGALRSDRILPTFDPVASLRYAPGCHFGLRSIVFVVMMVMFVKWYLAFHQQSEGRNQFNAPIINVCK